MPEISAAERAWREYRDGPARNRSRRALRKREFLAGWRAHAIFLQAEHARQMADGLRISDEVRGLVAAGQLIPAIKQLRTDNNASLHAAKIVAERIRDGNA